MAGTRVHELAKKLKISSKELLARLRELGLEVKSHQSILDAQAVKLVSKKASPALGEKKKVRKKEVKAEKPKKREKAPEPKPKEARKPKKREKAPEPKPKEARKPRRLPEKVTVAKKPGKARRVRGKTPAKEEKPVVVPREEAAPPAAVAVVEKPAPKRPGRKRPKKEEKAHPAVAVEEEKAEPEREVAVEVAPPKGEKAPAVTAAPTKLILDERITVGELAEKLGMKPSALIRKLISLGVFASINQRVGRENLPRILSEYGREGEIAVAPEEMGEIPDVEDEPSKLRPRPPIVTVMGHVNHGKTSLLDAIRETDVVAREKGGITQHIGASEVHLPGGKVVFLDTPGHEAFTAMRARGAQVTDVVVLVVAADDGIRPQTVEAIDHARAAGVPIVVAINKIDVPNASPERVKRQLMEYGLTPEVHGGKTICVEVSALKRMRLEHLLEMLLMEAEMLELKANPDRLALGTIIEARLDRGRGPVATVLIQKGTLHVGDAFLAGLYDGKVRAMFSDRGKRVKKATPATAVEVLGLSSVPEAGDIFQEVESEKKAREIGLIRQMRRREEEPRRVQAVTLEDLYRRVKEEGIRELKIILKADVRGSVEALRQSLVELGTEEVKLTVIHGAVGEINESDVLLASASDAIVIGFHVGANPNAQRLAPKEEVDVRTYGVIYDAIADVKAALEGLLAPKLKEVVTGQAEVRQVFDISRLGRIAGCYVKEGEIVRDGRARILRGEEKVYEGKIASLRRFKEDVNRIASGFECGISLAEFHDMEEGDIIECYRVEKESRRL